MNRQVTKWIGLLKKDRTDTHDEERSARSSVISEKLMQQVKEKVRDDRRDTLDTPRGSFPRVSRGLLGQIVSERLGLKKLCALWKQKIMTQASRYFFRRSLLPMRRDAIFLLEWNRRRVLLEDFMS